MAEKVKGIVPSKEPDESERGELTLKILPVIMEADYFAYLVLTGEVKDKVVLNYYRNQVNTIFRSLRPFFDSLDVDLNEHTSPFPYILKLTKKWGIEV